MGFRDTFTTQEKITADKDGIEVKKTIVSNDAYAVGSIIDDLLQEIKNAKYFLK